MKHWPIVGLFVLVSACSMMEQEPERVHVVVRGDTLTRIAKHHGVTVQDLMTWNGLTSDRIEVGQSLALKTSQPSVVAPVERKSRRTTKQPATKRRPKTKPCLQGPSLDDLDNDDVDIRGSQGLDLQQLRTAMVALPTLVGGCFEGSWPTATVMTSVTVGCSGVVQNVKVLDGDGLGGGVLECMREAVHFVEFPAHDMPDGFTFQYPIQINP